MKDVSSNICKYNIRYVIINNKKLILADPLNYFFMKILFTLILSGMICQNISSQILKFAVIGDYGKAGANELNVSNLVKSWNPQFVITLGDNNYELGEDSTIDQNIGQYYHEFIYPYYGTYGSGDTVNRFFPSMGNHDWYTDSASAFLSYFTLPGNERYYDFVKGNIHFFSIDSDVNEPDGIDSSSVQANWLKNALYNSASEFKIVYFHHAPYSSSSSHGSNPVLQWPFKKWGASVVMAGHDHTYERLFIDSITYIVNGLGGKSIYAFGTPVAGSQVRYNNNYGAMKVNSYNDSLVCEFFSVSGNRRDYFRILPADRKLNLTAVVEGLFNEKTNITFKDTIRVYLRNSVSPYTAIDSSVAYSDSLGKCNFIFNNAENVSEYFIVVNQRNSIETWSSSATSFHVNCLNYDFTFDSTSAYGSNLIKKGTKFCIFSGDINKDGVVDATDSGITDNAAAVFLTGYTATDLNGDEITDASDLSIVENNSFKFITAIHP